MNGLQALDTGFPEFGENETTEEKLEDTRSYLFSMLETLRYVLSNLDEDNFNEIGLEEIAEKFQAKTIISNTNITQEIYADYGNIADLTVDRLRTDYTKAQKYLKGDTSDVNYLYIHDETISFITAKAGTGTEQLVDGDRKFYWQDDTHAQMTSEKETAFPVTVYQYTELVKAKIAFTSITLPDGTTTVMPVLTLGAGTGIDGNDTLTIYKPPNKALFEYVTPAGVKSFIEMSNFVDAKGRRLQSCYINKTNSTITVTQEGATTSEVITYVEGTNSITYTFPDNFTTTVSIS